MLILERVLGPAGGSKHDPAAALGSETLLQGKIWRSFRLTGESTTVAAVQDDDLGAGAAVIEALV
jgi:hypothetical protein